MKKLIVPIAAFGLMSGAAFAQDAANNFATLDTDLNGELSFVEVTVGWPELTQAEFDAADVDMSGGLSVDELASIVGATTLPAPAEGALTLPAPSGGAMAPAPAPAPADTGPAESLVSQDDD
jgi:hypothetical protein